VQVRTWLPPGARRSAGEQARSVDPDRRRLSAAEPSQPKMKTRSPRSVAAIQGTATGQLASCSSAALRVCASAAPCTQLDQGYVQTLEATLSELSELSRKATDAAAVPARRFKSSAPLPARDRG